MTVETSYRAHVERAIRYILAHRAEPILLEDVARAAHLSPFHFHRIFTAVMGETVGRFVTRHRLELAAMALAWEPGRSVTDIALDAGYSSLSNFSKAFAAWFGISPSGVRASADPAATPALAPLTARRGEAFAPAELYALPPAPSAAERERLLAELGPVRYEVRPTLDLACLASPAGYELATLESLWADLVARAIELDLVGPDGEVDAYGLAFDSPVITAPERCRYHACVPCPRGRSLPLPLFPGAIPAGRYAVFRYAGPVAGVAQAYRTIYSVWLPSTALAPDDFVAFEHYVNDAPVDGHVTYDIHIKLRDG